MPNSTAERFARKKTHIMNLWVERALKEVAAAHHQEDLALRNSLPEYLGQIEDALSTIIERTEARALTDKMESTRIGKKHGKERAGSANYSIDQLIYEYHILRQVICDVMEEEKVLTPIEREVIVCSIEQAVNDAATQFCQTLKEIQEQFTNTLTHDLRSPLSVAKMDFQMILRKPDDTDNVLRKSAQGVSNLDRLDRLIQDLLDGSRMKAGELIAVELNEDCDLNWIIKEVRSDISSTYPNRIEYKDAGPCLGRWNESGLRRVLENLINNAIKYGDPSSPILVALSQTTKTATFSVHNFGNSLKQEEIPLLFQQFRRLRSAEEKTGWGLGLTVVKGMVDAHQGKIEVISEKSLGTTFKITLPKTPQETTLRN